MIKRLFIKFWVWVMARWIKDPDLMDVMVDLSDYDPMDRYRDFRQTFGTPHGQRVLSQIMLWGRVNKSIFDLEPTAMALKESERNMALKIMAGLTEPVKLPTERRKR